MSHVLLDGLDHGQTHVDAITRVLGATDGETGDAVVAVPEDLDPHALRDNNSDITLSRGVGRRQSSNSELYLIILRQLVEPAKELVQCGHQLGGRQFFGERREVHDVSVQDAVENMHDMLCYEPWNRRSRLMFGNIEVYCTTDILMFYQN